MTIQEYNCEIKHIAGKDNCISDALSRSIMTAETEEKLNVLEVLDDLALEAKREIITRAHEDCGHASSEVTCQYIKKFKKWDGFHKEV
jgi:hypothetical protein